MDLLGSLKALCAVAEHGSLTRGSVALGVTQSILSRQIAALETHVGAKLLHRTGRGVAPTELGLRILPQAAQLLRGLDDLVAEMAGERSGPSGTVELAMVPSVRPLAVQVFKSLQEAYPRIKLRTREAYSGQVEEWIANGKVDIGLFNRYSSAPVKNAEAVLRAPLVVLGLRETAKEAPTVAFRKLDGVPLAMATKPNALVTMLEATAKRCKISLDIAFESTSDTIIRAAVGNGALFTIVPLHVAFRDYGPERYAWSQIVEPGLVQHTWLATTSAHPIDAAARVVQRLLVELASSAAQHGAQVPSSRR
ncbi:LysR family transcriptional regulator [Variovorax sp. dw_954]|uniref:LysR family transcriptional regulator n=1 Tax=Variovorax sp. dw_954 TaxID=2720078 RepID=UPI001BD26918|nr:LysR family transcriptional regulator [Variovorax sp. dw_954]